MKKFLAMLCAFLVCCFFNGCKEKDDETTNSDPIISTPDTENMTDEELEEYFSKFPFNLDEPIVLPDDE